MKSVVELLIAATGLSFTGFFVFCLVSFLGSDIAGALALGGGVLVLATMTSWWDRSSRRPVRSAISSSARTLS